MDQQRSVHRLEITITIDWKFVLSVGCVLLARLLAKQCLYHIGGSTPSIC